MVIEKKNVIEEKITRYSSGIELAKELNQRFHADHDYYSDILSRYEKLLKFYKDLKICKDFTRK